MHKFGYLMLVALVLASLTTVGFKQGRDFEAKHGLCAVASEDIENRIIAFSLWGNEGVDAYMQTLYKELPAWYREQLEAK